MLILVLFFFLVSLTKTEKKGRGGKDSLFEEVKSKKKKFCMLHHVIYGSNLYE
jgi:hypothetical protein